MTDPAFDTDALLRWREEMDRDIARRKQADCYGVYDVKDPRHDFVFDCEGPSHWSEETRVVQHTCSKCGATIHNFAHFATYNACVGAWTPASAAEAA